MKKVRVLYIFILVAIIIIFSIAYYLIFPPCKIGYYKYWGECVSKKIPEGMKYWEPDYYFADEGLWRVGDNEPLGIMRLSFEEKKKYFIWDDGYFCVKDESPAKFVNYFYYGGGVLSLTGVGRNRGAIVCEDYYFVEESSSTYGSITIGPFNFSN